MRRGPGLTIVGLGGKHPPVKSASRAGGDLLLQRSNETYPLEKARRWDEGMADAQGLDWAKSLIFPISVWVAQQLATGAVASYRWLKRQYFLYTNILEEIRCTRGPTEELAAAFRQALYDGVFRQRLVDDPNYFVFVVSADPSPSIFRSDSSEFAALSPNTSRDIIAYFETQSLISETLSALRSEDFRILHPDRKMQAIQDLMRLFDESEVLGRSSEQRLLRAARRTPYRRVRRAFAAARRIAKRVQAASHMVWRQLLQGLEKLSG